MTRDADALLITATWASGGDVEMPSGDGITFTVGWPAAFSQAGGPTPKREHFNWLLRAISAFIVEVNAHGGILAWNAGLAYDHPAIVMGSNDVVYRSKQDSTGVDPTSDNDESHWEPFGQAPDATTSARGLVELATETEAAAGTRTDRAVTPAGLARRTPNAGTGARGLVELATNAEATAGTDAARAVTPAALANRLTSLNADTVDSRHVRVLTQAQYDALSSKDANTIYFTT